MIQEYINENKERMLEELFSLIRIPSVSTQPDKHRPDMMRCAQRWQELLTAAGVDRTEIMPTAGNPIVYAEKMVNSSAKTLRRYASRTV